MLLIVSIHFVKLMYLEVRDHLRCQSSKDLSLETSPANRDDFGRRTTLLWERLTSTIGLPITYLLTWFRVLIVSFLLRIKQTNDAVLNQIQQKPILFVLPQRLLIYTGSTLDYLILRLRSNEQTERKQQTRHVQQKQFVSR